MPRDRARLIVRWSPIIQPHAGARPELAAAVVDEDRRVPIHLGRDDAA